METCAQTVLFRGVLAATVLCWIGIAGLGVYRAINASDRATIRYDLGGTIGDYLDRYATSGPVAIVGTCMSACTLALSRSDTCVAPDALLGFHAATNALGTQLMLSMYPRRIRSWIASQGGLTPHIITMFGADAIRLGVSRCP